MTLPPFVLVTGNAGKVRETERILGFAPEHIDLDLPEIQSLDLVEVLQAKAESAWQALQRPLVVEETGFGLDALGGFPGPLVKWMLQAVGPEGLARLAERLDDPGAVAHCGLLYRSETESVIAEGLTRGTLTSEARGSQGFGWDPVFRPEGFDLTYAELAAATKDEIGHRGRAWRNLIRRWSALDSTP